MNQKLNALTGLRFIAAAMIVVHHLRSSLLPHEFLRGWPIAAGVSFFFVLSGFILTFVYPNLEKPGATKDFIIARVKRLWPAHLIAILMIFALVGGSVHPVPVLLSNVFLIQAWLPISQFFFSFNAPSWSISTELFFYLAFPFLILNFARTWWWKLAAALGIALAMVMLATLAHLPPYKALDWQVTYTGVTYINPLARVFEFVVGMCLALAFGTVRNWVKLGLAIGTLLEGTAIALFLVNASQVAFVAHSAGVAFGPAAGNWASHSAGLLPGTVLLVFVMAFDLGYFSRLLGCKIAVFLGELSFPIYMVHVVVLRYALSAGLFDGLSEGLKLGLYVFLVFAFSLAMWPIVEKRPRRAILARLARLMSPVLAIPRLALQYLAALSVRLGPFQTRRRHRPKPSLATR